MAEISWRIMCFVILFLPEYTLTILLEIDHAATIYSTRSWKGHSGYINFLNYTFIAKCTAQTLHFSMVLSITELVASIAT